MISRRSIATACIAALVAATIAVRWTSTGIAQNDNIRMRQEVLGTFGDAVKEPGAMLRQEAAFDIEIVRASLKKIADGSPKLRKLFPDDSKSGAYTEALPVIWERKEAFLAIFDKLGESAVKASAAIKDEATFRSEWGKVSANCRECHKAYRALPKN